MDGLDPDYCGLFQLHHFDADRDGNLAGGVTDRTASGFLPLTTTRGDRLFISLLGAAYIHLGWIAFTDLALWIGSVIALFWLIIVMRWG